ncbi:MAG: hypothetical protein Q9170_006186 [Blastenia crenularia]
MLAHGDGQSGTRSHEPLRNSTLRQVTLTDEGPITGATDDPGPECSSLSSNARSSEWKTYQKIVKLGFHDASSLGSGALLDPKFLPDDVLGRGNLIAIYPAPDVDDATDDPLRNGKSGKKWGKISDHELAKGNRKYLFIANPMMPETSGKLPNVQVSISTDEATRCGLRNGSQVLVSTVWNRSPTAT